VDTGRATDAADFWFRGARLNPAFEVRPVSKTVFEGDDMLRVRQIERRPSTDRFLDPLAALRVVCLNAPLKFARAGAIPRDVEAFR